MQWRWIILLMMTVLIVFGSIHDTAYGENTIGYFPPQPKDVVVLVSKPNISMQFILNGNKIASIDMQLNGKKVEAQYDTEQQIVFYIPKEPLKAGKYKVNLSVRIEGWDRPVNQSWQFTVSEKAVDQLPSPTEEQKMALSYINLYRKFLGLKSLQLDDALNTAAMAHANYMAINKKTTHDEFANYKGFTGVTFYHRAGAFGYNGGYVAENVSSGQKDYKEAVNGLIDGPYHRLSWLNPFFTDLGYGVKDKYYTFLLGGKKAEKDTIMVYPLDRQMDVPVSWDGNETPNPLRFYSRSGKVGYPITLSYFSGKTIEKFTVDKARLTNSKGSLISIHLNTPSKDHQLQDSTLIIPTYPLEKGEKYTVLVKGKIQFQDKTTQTIEKTWSFTTANTDDASGSWVKYVVFDDIQNHWAKDAVMEMAKKQIVSAKTGTLFKPDDPIHRAEFAEFIVNALGLPIKSYEGAFKDVYKDTNKALYIESAYREGIIKGVGNGYFAPKRLITREEMAVMIIRAYEKKKGQDGLNDLPSITFADKNEISPWALEAAKASSHLGIIKGRGHHKFVPKDSATRAEAAVMVKRLMEKL